MALNSFDVETTRRLSIALIAAGVAMLFSAFDLIGVGVSAGDREFAHAVSKATVPLALAVCFGLFALICAEIAGHADTPKKGHPHNVTNYLQTAFALIGFLGLAHLLFGGFRLVAAVQFVTPSGS